MSKHTIQELQTNIDYLNTTKSMLKNAIINKGQSISESDTFRDYADKISAITTSTKVVLPDKLKFNGSSQVQSFDFLSDFDLSNLYTMEGMFQSCIYITTIPLFDTSNINNARMAFYGCTSLTTVPLFNTSSVTNMASMFYACTSLTSVPLFDTSNATSFYEMFKGCTSLTTIPLYNTSKVVYFKDAFKNCPNLSNESLNNILYICAHSNVTNVEYKTLVNTGLSSTQITTCQTLSNWDDFVAAGWSTGY